MIATISVSERAGARGSHAADTEPNGIGPATGAVNSRPVRPRGVCLTSEHARSRGFSEADRARRRENRSPRAQAEERNADERAAPATILPALAR
jgi:hypothetical protein